MTAISDRLAAALADRYALERELGAGGMATVYLARDLRHDRRVAIKVLKPDLAAVLGADRFVAEIKTTAALQHPHILPLFDSGEAQGFLWYAMPYIEGETLRNKLDREHQLGVDESVALTTAVADALDYAHRHGVIHRDIKPENILLHDGRPMVADFGIALAVSAAAGGRMTETGLSLGTPHYMSPEQATADKEITGRSDIYSLGSVCYEMLTGNPPHTGASAQQIIMKIVTEEAAPVTRVRKNVPAHVAAAVGKAIEKLPADRFATAREFAEALANPGFRTAATTGGGAESVRLSARPSARLTAALAAVALLATAAAAWGWLRRSDGTGEVPVVRVAVALPDDQPLVFGGINLTPPRAAITRDGSAIVYVGPGPVATVLPGGGQAYPSSQFTLGVGSQLWLRPLDALEARTIGGTEGGWAPSISPDGRRVAFTVFTQSQADVRVVPIGGGPPITVASDVGTSAAWGDDEALFFVDRDGRRLLRAAPSGGPVDTVVTLDSLPEGARLQWPDLGPGARWAIVTIGIQAESRQLGHQVHLLDLERGTTTKLADGLYGRYSPSGLLLYVTADNVLMAMPLDPRSGMATGRPVAIVESVDYRSNGAGDVAVSGNGSLIYTTPGVNAPEQVVWATRDGTTRPLDPAWTGDLEVEGLALSPDESRLAVELVSLPEDGTASLTNLTSRTVGGLTQGAIWVKQLPRGPLSRLTFGSVDARAPSWSPDGRSIVYLVRGGDHGSTVVRQSADGSGSVEALPQPPRELDHVQWSRDGQWLVGGMSGPPSDDIVGLRVEVDTAWSVLAGGPADEFEPTISPDGRWLAYASDESGRTEIYVRPFPNVAGGRWQVSTAGGIDPLWSASGRELYYRTYDGNGVWQATLASGPEAAVREEVLRIPLGAYEANPRNRLLEVSADGQRFLLVHQTGEGDVSGELVFVQNFVADLRRKADR